MVKVINMTILGKVCKNAASHRQRRESVIAGKSKKTAKGVPTLDDILLACVRGLAAAGRAEMACRLAGQACAAHRLTDAAAWRRFNVLLHQLTKHVSESVQ